MHSRTDLLFSLGAELHQSLRYLFSSGEVTCAENTITDRGVTLDIVTFSYDNAHLLMLSYNAVSKRMQVSCGVALNIIEVCETQERLLDDVLTIVQSYCIKFNFISEIVFRGFTFTVVARCVKSRGYTISLKGPLPIVRINAVS